MKFIADCMLGKLAKWLRILGYDTLYQRPPGDAALAQKALAAGRLLLTRNAKLLARLPLQAGLLIASDHVAEQLQQVVFTLHLEVSDHLLTRCLACNAELQPIAKHEAAAAVPDFIYHTHADFARCPRCGKIYWQGSHHAHIAARVKHLQTSNDSSL